MRKLIAGLIAATLMAAGGLLGSSSPAHAWTAVPSDCPNNYSHQMSTSHWDAGQGGVNHLSTVTQTINTNWEQYSNTCAVNVSYDDVSNDGTPAYWWQCVNFYRSDNGWHQTCWVPGNGNGSWWASGTTQFHVPYGVGWGICEGPNFLGQYYLGNAFGVPGTPNIDPCEWDHI